MASRNVVCFLRVRIYYTIALKRGIRTHWPMTGSLTTIDNSRWTSDSRWHIFFEPTSKLMMYLLSLQSIKEMTTTEKKDTVKGIFFPPFQCPKLGVFLVLRKLLLVSYSPLWGCAGDRVEMVVKVHMEMFWLTNLPPCWKFVPKTIPPCTGQPSRPGLSRNLRVANCVVAYSTAQKWVTSRVSFPVRRESRSAGIIDVAISGINYWRHVQCLFNLVYRYYFIWWLHPTPTSRSFPKSHFLSVFLSFNGNGT